MPVIRSDVTPELFNRVVERNLRQQYFLLETIVELGIHLPTLRPTKKIACELNSAAVRFLAHSPGSYRDDEVHINGSPHEPPTWGDVPQLMDEYFTYLKSNWEISTAIHLASYALWRLNWVHPFEDGNGRTARAMGQLVLCLKYSLWLPGRRTILGQIEDDRDPYIQALQSADAAYQDGESINLSAMELYLEQLLIAQLTS